MTQRRPLRPAALIAVVLVALALALAGCGSDSKSGKPKESAKDRLAAAKSAIDKTSGLEFSLKAKKLPSSVSGVLSAVGTGTHQPAFKGDIKVFQDGLSATVPVVAVKGKVYVKFGIWQAVDPGQYNAPDPADLMSTSTGLSAMLTEATDVSKGKEQREGKEVVTTYDAKVPGSLIAKIIPTASDKGDFDATFTLSKDNRLTKAVLKGEFYPDADDVTYTLTFDKYGAKADIKAP